MFFELVCFLGWCFFPGTFVLVYFLCWCYFFLVFPSGAFSLVSYLVVTLTWPLHTLGCDTYLVVSLIGFDTYLIATLIWLSHLPGYDIYLVVA